MHLVERKDLTPQAWDAAVGSFKRKSLFHQSAWLSYMEARHRGRRLLLEIRDNGDTVGFFPAVVVQKGPFRLLGSPLKGSWTIHMGPVADALNTKAFVPALERFCRDEGIAYAELASLWLDSQAMQEAGFTRFDDATYILPILSPDAMWRRMKKNARSPVRQAQRYGLEAVTATAPTVMSEYYEQYQAVLARQHLPMDWPLEMFSALWEHLYPSGNLLVWRILYRGKSVATNIFLLDESTIYWWANACWPDCYWLRANDFVQWEIMKFAAERGIRFYDLYGEGQFKQKFGAQRVPLIRWYKTFSLPAKVAREMYASWWYGRREVKRLLRQYWCKTFVRQIKPGTAHGEERN